MYSGPEVQKYQLMPYAESKGASSTQQLQSGKKTFLTDIQHFKEKYHSI